MTDGRNSRLVATEVPGLRQRIKGGLTNPYQEADRYGVGVETIRRAVRGETFRFVKEGLPEATETTRYGRRKDDLVRESDAKESLERFMAEGNRLEPPPEVEGDGVQDFLNMRKDKP